MVHLLYGHQTQVLDGRRRADLAFDTKSKYKADGQGTPTPASRRKDGTVVNAWCSCAVSIRSFALVFPLFAVEDASARGSRRKSQWTDALDEGDGRL